MSMPVSWVTQAIVIFWISFPTETGVDKHLAPQTGRLAAGAAGKAASHKDLPAISTQRLAGMLQRHCVERIQELVEIDNRLASARCCCSSRFQFLKLRDPLAKSSLGWDLSLSS